MRVFSLAVISIIVMGRPLMALPIGFGEVPGNVEYHETATPNFLIYHDRRTPEEARYMAESLERARPILERWFERSRSSPLPVVMSATTEQASFANFITDAIELQTMGQGTRDLAWHEYVHHVMYRHFCNILGPAGSVLHLMWMPSWFVEGLAEALSVSIGSDQQASIERFHARRGKWPSYERMHSLYGGHDFSYRGYALSGSFVSYILRKPFKFTGFLKDYYRHSMPWIWPYSAIPWVDSLPLDRSLESYVQANGESLWSQYQEDARAYWQKQSGFVSVNRQTLKTIARPFEIVSSGGEIWTSRSDRDFNRAVFTPFAKRTKFVLEEKVVSWTKTSRGLLQAVLSLDSQQVEHTTLLDENKRIIAQLEGRILQIKTQGERVAWLWHKQQDTRLCVSDRKKYRCDIVAKAPHRLDLLGDERGWLVRRSFAEMRGDRYELFAWSGESSLGQMLWTGTTQPSQAQKVGEELWVLMAEKSGQTLQKWQAGTCTGQIAWDDLVYSFAVTGETRLHLSVYSGEDDHLVELRTSSLTWKTCAPLTQHESPLLYAMRHPNVSLHEAVLQAGTWAKTAATSEVRAAETSDPSASISEAREAQWRGRPVVTVPWLGADSDGLQVALLSVPLMDHMQNEDVRLYVGYGLTSAFPHTELSLTSQRAGSRWKLDVFRYQSWNGRYIDEDEEERLAYVDERGIRLGTGWKWWRASWDLGLETVEIRKFRGAPWTKEGQLNVLRSTWTLPVKLGPSLLWSQQIGIEWAPAGANPEFDFHQWSAREGLRKNWNWRDSFAAWELAASMTRGTSMRELQEVQRPLPVYVPTGGSTFQQMNVGLLGDGSLFEAEYGNTAARSTWTGGFNLIEDVDQLIRIFYWDAVIAEASVSYGGVWRDDRWSKERIKTAHSYRLNASFDAKGVRFYAGGGVGQVAGHSLGVFGSFSFDALF